MAASREQLGKHIPVLTDTHATIGMLLPTEFSTVVGVEGL
jgi:hypothetical protein